MTGVMLNDATLVNEAINYVKESLAFYCYEDGSFTEMYRSYYDGVDGGLNYASNTLYGMLEIAHVLALGEKRTYSTITRRRESTEPKAQLSSNLWNGQLLN